MRCKVMVSRGILFFLPVVTIHGWTRSVFPSRRDRSRQWFSVSPVTCTMHDGTVQSTTTEFITSPIPVYIEDTDAYGVIYNANYLRAYDRAIQSWNPLPKTKNNEQNHIICKVESMKYKQSPMLGEKYVITGRPRTESSSTNPNVWDLAMTSPDGSIVYNVAQGVHVTAMSPARRKSSTEISAHPEMKDEENGQLVFTHEYTTHRDEFNPDHRLPLHTHLKYFERSRSDTLGGPRSLQKLQEQHNILVVVTSNQNCESLTAFSDDGETIDESQISTVRVTTEIRLRRRSSVVECDQVAWYESRPIARALTTVMVIDATSKRPTPLPDWVLQNNNQFLS